MSGLVIVLIVLMLSQSLLSIVQYKGTQLVNYSNVAKEKGASQTEKALSQIYTRKLEAVT